MINESLELLNEILFDYEILKSIHIDDKIRQKFYLDEDCHICRFCRKSSPHVDFKTVAHAFPELIGNRFMLSHIECDTCNNRFSKTLEAEMANFMSISHTVAGIQGKNKDIPKYKRNGTALNSDGKNIVIRNIEIDKSLEFQHEKTFSVALINPAFVPIAVYKCLTKMALTLMPEQEMHTFEKTLEWINEEHHDNSKFSFESLIAIYSHTKIQFPFISAILLKRKSNVQKDIPNAVFRLTYGNFSFQIYIPLCELDKNNSYQPDQIIYIPHLIDIKKGLTISEKQYVDFNITTKIKTSVTDIEIENLNTK